MKKDQTLGRDSVRVSVYLPAAQVAELREITRRLGGTVAGEIRAMVTACLAARSKAEREKYATIHDHEH